MYDNDDQELARCSFPHKQNLTDSCSWTKGLHSAVEHWRERASYCVSAYSCVLYMLTLFFCCLNSSLKLIWNNNLKTKIFHPSFFFFNCWRSTNMTQMCTGDNPHHANTLRDLFRLAGLEKHLHILRWWETPSGCPCTSLLSRHIPSEIYFKSAPTVGLATHVLFLLLQLGPLF